MKKPIISKDKADEKLLSKQDSKKNQIQKQPELG
jgi:hypothetical protein